MGRNMARAFGTQLIEVDEDRAIPETESVQTASSAISTWLFPGLGCRYVGMGNDIIGHFPAADRLIAQAGVHLGYDVAAVCLEGLGRKHVPARQEAQVIYVVECAYSAVL